MARRCLEKFVINGSDYSLMQIDLNNISLGSYSERTNLYLQSGTSTPSYVTDTGYDFDIFIPNITVTVDIPIENSVNASIHNRPYQLSGHTAGFIGINYNETNEYIGSGGTNHSKDCFAIILDDGGYAWILQYGIESGYSWVEAIGGNNSIGQSIYNNFKQSTGGGAGSGYIGNSLLSNKKMVGYNVPTSDVESTKTESVNVFDSNPVANKPKSGNGHARIKFLRDAQIIHEVSISASNNFIDSINNISPTVLQGSYTYDSESNSMYFASNTALTYTDAFKGSDMVSAKKVIFEVEAKITSNSSGNGMDMVLGLYTWKMNAIVADGYSDSGAGKVVFEISGHEFLKGTSVLDNFIGDFHVVRYELSVNNLQPTHLSVYVDNSLYVQTDISDLTFNFSDYETVLVECIDHSYVRSCKIDIINGS